MDRYDDIRPFALNRPTEASIDHVWRMVAEQTSSLAVIVQITSMSNLWGDDWRAKLSTVSSEIDNDGTEKTKLLLHVHGEEEPHVVWHFLYKNWDNYSPFSLDDLGSFVEVLKLSSQYNAPSSPRIIHCYYWPQEAYDVIHDTVEILRQQRHGMIQTESQYLFLYQAIKKLWHDQYGAMAEEGSGASAAQRGEVES
ncbi:protein-tyrosine phosphatase-like protein [Trichoderma sp. SZMC 28014]